MSNTTIKSLTITCNTCHKIVSRSEAFFMNEFECCSYKCMIPFRDERIIQDRIAEEKNNPRIRFGAFAFSHGGPSAR